MPSQSPSTIHPLYPAPQPFRSGLLQVDETHRIYFEECGNPAGKPAVFLHGGPGGGIEPFHRGFWDPSHYRVVLLDQRGCGKSTPYASLKDNTTWHLVNDLEMLREHLRIERWQVFGGSWGSTLALAYAQAHPQHVTELVLRGIFLLRKKELDWFYKEGANKLFPDAWQSFEQAIPVEERSDLLAAYHRRLTSDDRDARLAAAVAWSSWEGVTSRLRTDPNATSKFAAPEFAEAFARIETHFFVNRGFFQNDGALLTDAAKIRHIPTVIVHGRYDVICPLENAWDLAQELPNAELVIVPEAGHSALEPGIASALVRATDHFRGF